MLCCSLESPRPHGVGPGGGGSALSAGGAGIVAVLAGGRIARVEVGASVEVGACTAVGVMIGSGRRRLGVEVGVAVAAAVAGAVVFSPGRSGDERGHRAQPSRANKASAKSAPPISRFRVDARFGGAASVVRSRSLVWSTPEMLAPGGSSSWTKADALCGRRSGDLASAVRSALSWRADSRGLRLQGCGRVRFQVLVQKHQILLALDRQPLCEHFVEHHAQGVDIAPRPYRPVSGRLLR